MSRTTGTFLLLLCVAYYALAVPITHRFTTTPDVVLDAPRIDTPASIADPVFRFALMSPAPIPDDLAPGSPEWIAWNATRTAALEYTAARACPGGRPPDPGYWTTRFPWWHSMPSQSERTREILMDARTSCKTFYRERIYAHTGMYPSDYGGFWSESCRCAYVQFFVARMFWSEFGMRTVCGVPFDPHYLVNDRSIYSSCSLDDTPNEEVHASTGGDLVFTRDALWAIPPLRELKGSPREWVSPCTCK